MADSVTIARAIIEVGAQGTKDTEKEIKTLQGSLTKLEASYKSGKISITEYASESAQIRTKIQTLQAGIAGAEAAIKKYGSAQAAAAAMSKQAEAASRSYGQGIMTASFALQDFLSANGDIVQGLYRIQNNIPQILTNFGLGSGLAGVVSTASLGFGLLLPYLVNAAKELGLLKQASEATSDAIAKLSLHIKELEDKPIKLAVDDFEIDQAKKKLADLEAAARAFKAMGETSSPEERASGEAVQRNIKNLGVAKGDQIQSDLKASMVQELTAQSETIKNAEREQARAEETKRKAELRLQFAGSMGGQQQAMADVEAANKRVEAAREAARKARREIDKEGGEAEREIGKIWKGSIEGNVESQKKLVERLRGIGQGALASSIESVRPGLMDQSAEDPDIARTNEFNIAIARKNREDREKEDSRLAAAMRNSVGQKYLANPQMSDETMRSEARKQMEKAGMSRADVDAAVEGVAKAIRKSIDSEIQNRAMDRGISENQASQQLLKEANELDDRQANRPKAEIMSTESYMSKLLVGALNQRDGATKDLPQKQLDAAKETNKILANGFKTLANPKKGTYATAAPGGRS